MQDFLLRNDSDRHIYKRSYVNNGYQFPADMSGMVVVDIGANIGTVARLCAERGAEVLAFEPEKENFKTLLTNVSGLSVYCFNLAIGLPGIRTLYIDPTNSGSHALFLNGQTGELARQEVMTVSLESVLPPVCDYIKIDCEFGELEIIPEITRNHRRIKNVVGEMHVDSCGYPTPEIDLEIKKMIRKMDRHYIRHNITMHEKLWTHR